MKNVFFKAMLCKMFPVKNGSRSRNRLIETACLHAGMLACYTPFVLVIIYVCRQSGTTKGVFSKAVSLPRAIFNTKSIINPLPCLNIFSVSGPPHYKRFSVMLARRSGGWFKNTLFVAAAKRQFNSFYTTKSVQRIIARF